VGKRKEEVRGEWFSIVVVIFVPNLNFITAKSIRDIVINKPK
jgi:hypothetical protein